MRISDWSSDVCSSDLLLPLVRGRVGGRAHAADAGVVEQEIDPPEARLGRGDHGIDVGLVRHVAVLAGGNAAAEFGDERLACAIVELGDENLTAAGDILPCGRGAHPRCASGDNCHPVPASVKIGSAHVYTPAT